MSIALLLAIVAGGAPQPATAPPDRLIECELGRPTNFAGKTVAELGLTGKHKVVVLQPSPAVEIAGQPLRPRAAAKLVRLHDPDKVMATAGFDRVLDGWPERLELLNDLPREQRAFLSLGQIDAATGAATGSAGLIMGDGATMVPEKFLQGTCRVENGRNLAAKFEKLAGKP